MKISLKTENIYKGRSMKDKNNKNTNEQYRMSNKERSQKA